MNTGKSNPGDVTTDMFMNMLKSGDVAQPSNNYGGSTGNFGERRGLMRG